jgi:hypothetical protein
MYQDMVIEIVQIVFIAAGTALANGWLASILTQALKWKAIAYPAQKYPAPTAIALSLILAVPAVYLTGLVAIGGVLSWVIIGVASILVATQSYDTVKTAIDQLKNPVDTTKK